MDPRERRAVVVAPATSGSLGDEAMICALAEQLRAGGVKEIIIATWRQEDDWRAVGGPVLQELLPHGDPAGKVRFTRRLRTAADLYLIGADVIDGAYSPEHSIALLSAAQLGVQCGLRTTIIGCSFCEHPNSQVVQYLNQLDPRVNLLARDGYSRTRMEQGVGRKLPLVADIAFLLKAAVESKTATQVMGWIARQRQVAGSLVLGCNLNPQPLISEGCEPGPLLAAHVEAITQWSNRFGAGFSAVILPHDYRVEHRELETCDMFHQMLPATLKERVLLVREQLSAAEFKFIAGQCDVMLAGRMHAGVAALGGARPVICLGRQGKFEGMLAHFGLEELVMPWRQALMPGRLASWGGEILSRRVDLADRVAAKLPSVIKLAQANLDSKLRGSEDGGDFPARHEAQSV